MTYDPLEWHGYFVERQPGDCHRGLPMARGTRITAV
jgi:hypothetical protein